MFEPFEGITVSTVDSFYKLQGDEEKIQDVQRFVQKSIEGGLALYDTQDSCRNYFCNKYGVEMYEKSAEAVQFLVENEYATLEREKTSDAFYTKNSGVLY